MESCEDIKVNIDFPGFNPYSGFCYQFFSISFRSFSLNFSIDCFSIDCVSDSDSDLPRIEGIWYEEWDVISKQIFDSVVFFCHISRREMDNQIGSVPLQRRDEK